MKQFVLCFKVACSELYNALFQGGDICHAAKAVLEMFLHEGI